VTVRRGLYAIVDSTVLGARDAVEFARRVLDAGELWALQLRAKDWPAWRMLETSTVLAHECRARGVPFYVNDRVDVARLAGAAGVHLGQTDLALSCARGIAPELLVGLSTHTRDELARALAERPDYVAFGPVFATASKSTPDPEVGPSGLRAAVAQANGTPVVAIGGISLERAGAVLDTGVVAAAVIGALAAVSDAELTAIARSLHRALGGR